MGWVCGYASIRQRLTWGTIFQEPSTLFLRQGLPLGPGTCQVGEASSSPRVLPVLTSQYWSYECATPACCFFFLNHFWGIELGFLCLHADTLLTAQHVY